MRIQSQVFAAILTVLAGSAAADSQSSNSSSNCSNGRCTRSETLVLEDRRGVRGYSSHRVWSERDDRHRRAEPGWRYDRRDADDRRRDRNDDDRRRGRDDDDD